MKQTRKKLAPKPIYKSPGQMVLAGFEAPFERKMNPKNPWVILAHLFPWDQLGNTHDLNFQQNSNPVGAITENFISDLSFLENTQLSIWDALYSRDNNIPVGNITPNGKRNKYYLPPQYMFSLAPCINCYGTEQNQ